MSGKNLGTDFGPIVQTLSGLTGSLGQEVWLATDKRKYYWHVDSATWRPVTPILVAKLFAYGSSPYILDHTPTPDVTFKGFVDGVLYDPSKYSLSGLNLTLAATSPPTYGTDLWVYYAY